MPLLSESDLRNLLNCTASICSTCQATVRKNYCRTCDEFFWQGHKPGCTSTDIEHLTHRKYDLETGQGDPPIFGVME
jgi:hypothetical protein